MYLKLRRVIISLVAIAIVVSQTAFAEDVKKHDIVSFTVNPSALALWDSPQEVLVSGVSKYPNAKIIIKGQDETVLDECISDDKGEFNDLKAGVFYPRGSFSYKFSFIITSKGAPECTVADDYVRNYECLTYTFATPAPSVGISTENKILVSVGETALYQNTPELYETDVYLRGKTNYPNVHVFVNANGVDYDQISNDTGEFVFNLSKIKPLVSVKVWAKAEGLKDNGADVSDSDVMTYTIGTVSVDGGKIGDIKRLQPITTDSKVIKAKNAYDAGTMEIVLDEDSSNVLTGGSYADGWYVYKLSKTLKLGTKVSVRIINTTKNDGPSGEVNTIVALQKPVLKSMNLKKRTLKGVCYAKSTVQAYVGKKLIGKAVCASSGKFQIVAKRAQRKRLKKGQNLVLKASCLAGGKMYKAQGARKIK